MILEFIESIKRKYYRYYPFKLRGKFKKPFSKMIFIDRRSPYMYGLDFDYNLRHHLYMMGSVYIPDNWLYRG